MRAAALLACVLAGCQFGPAPRPDPVPDPRPDPPPASCEAACARYEQLHCGPPPCSVPLCESDEAAPQRAFRWNPGCMAAAGSCAELERCRGS